jgi:hypothetical protein
LHKKNEGVNKIEIRHATTIMLFLDETIMKSIKQKNISLILLFVVTLFYGCEDVNHPTNYEKELKLEIVYVNQVSIDWDSTVYQHKPIYSSYDTTYVDSLANVLKESKILIEDMWCPNSLDTECSILLISGRGIIIKLKEPDSSIYQYGFQENDGSFLIGCFRFWRHYKFIYK